MTSAEKILSAISEQSKLKASEIIKEAEEKAAEIKNEALLNAKAQAEHIIDDANKKAKLIKATGKSGAQLILREASLECRRQQINLIIEKTVEKINNMSDSDYFDFLMAIVDKNELISGTMYLNANDLKRDISNFKSKLKGIEISDIPANINGGFILKQGDIEINASLGALVHEKRSILVDEINNIIGKG